MLISTTRKRFRATNRWLLAEYIFSMFGEFDALDYRTPLCAFSNTFHLGDPPVFYLKTRSLLSFEIVCKIQMMLKELEELDYLCIYFFDELHEPNGGCRITSLSVESLQGRKIFTAELRTETKFSFSILEEIRRSLVLIKAAPDAQAITEYFLWEEIITRIQRGLPASIEAAKIPFEIIPYSEAARAAVIAFSNSCDVSEELILYFEELIWDLNPWEIWVTTNQTEPSLLYSIFSGGHTNYVETQI